MDHTRTMEQAGTRVNPLPVDAIREGKESDTAVRTEAAPANLPIGQETQRVSQPNWSADRRWYWNGQAWVAVPRRKALGPLLASAIVGSLSLVMLVLGAGVALLESNNHSVCQSGFGQLAQALDQNAASQCASANFYFYGGGVIAFLGGIALIAALIIGITGVMRDVRG